MCFISHEWFPSRRSDGREDENGGETANCQEGTATEKGRMETCVSLFFTGMDKTSLDTSSGSLFVRHSLT